MDAIDLPYDEHGRYYPAPGTEYAFHISDIGRAAVRLLGHGWTAEAASWGHGAFLDFQGQTLITLRVDEDNELFVRHDLFEDGKGTVLFPDLDESDLLDTFAYRVANAVKELCAKYAEQQSAAAGEEPS
ncbi:hypothetical protein ACPCVO_45225 [Streptomyces umbrinus]|uniref:hypothetical protein n=1 Tax=Streptomyces umbrinus TaxID=67370 RepID=UPI003C2E9E5F